MRQLDKEKENSEFKPVKLRLKNDLMSYPAWAEGLVYIYIYIYIVRERENERVWERESGEEKEKEKEREREREKVGEND